MRLVSALVSTTLLIGVIVPRAVAVESTTAQLTPFVMLDVATEKDSVSPIKNEYFNKHITTGFKTAGKWEYSLKLGTSDKDAKTYKLVSNVIEGKIKKSFEVRKGIYPYVSARFAEKTYSGKTKPYTASFTYYSVTPDPSFRYPTRSGLISDFVSATRISTRTKASAITRCCFSTSMSSIPSGYGIRRAHQTILRKIGKVCDFTGSIISDR